MVVYSSTLWSIVFLFKWSYEIGYSRAWIFQKYLKIACGISWDYIKIKSNFQGQSRKNHEEFALVLVFSFGILKRCHTILQDFQGWSFGLFRISKGNVTNLEISVVFSKKYVFFMVFSYKHLLRFLVKKGMVLSAIHIPVR